MREQKDIKLTSETVGTVSIVINDDEVCVTEWLFTHAMSKELSIDH
ncbi:MAG: hypothetical protein HKN25_09295 [Pyrinomonadaceae bacterium]|nr:hypothetical protein [Pyrinomonadaceae bacterium]